MKTVLLITLFLLSLLHFTQSANLDRLAKNALFYFDENDDGSLNFDELKKLITSLDLSDTLAKRFVLKPSGVMKRSASSASEQVDNGVKSILSVLRNELYKQNDKLAEVDSKLNLNGVW